MNGEFQPLQTGIIGLAQSGPGAGLSGVSTALLEELAGQNRYQIVALGDPDKDLAQRTARRYDAAAYDDLRLLIVQEKLDVLFILLPPCHCQELMPLAARRPVHVYKTAPLGRGVPEARQWVQQMARAGRQFHCEAPGRFCQGFEKARLALKAGLIGRVYLVQGEVFVNIHASPGWRGDPVLAGGGVLMDLGYGMVDQMVLTLGQPEQVYCQYTCFCSKRTLPPLQTEDTAILSLSFADGAMGHLTCSWMSGPRRQRLVFYGTEGIIELNGSDYIWRDLEGGVVQQESYAVAAGEYLRRQLGHFADCVSGVNPQPLTLARDHLPVISVLESAYLSARTHAPERLKVYNDIY